MRGRRPPGPRTLSPLGHLSPLRRDILGFLESVAGEFGDIACFQVAGTDVALLNHPDLIRDVLVRDHRRFAKGRPLEAAKRVLGDGLLTSEGDEHDRHRRIIAPAFRHSRLEAYASVMTEYAAALSDRWEQDRRVDMVEEMIHLATAIAGKTLFDKSFGRDEVHVVSRALGDVLSLFPRVSIPFAEQFLKLPLPSNMSFRTAKRRLDSLVSGIIERGRRNADGDSLLALLLAAQAEADERGPLTDEQVHDEVLTLLLTALDTTSLALTWTWYLLSRNPRAEQQLHEEVDRVLAGRPASVTDVQRLTCTRSVLTEAIRLFPPLYVVVREPRADYAVRDYVLPAGCQVLMSPYLMHRDARYYSDPEAFEPRRWDPAARDDRPKFAYFPFGGGPRVCIGEGYAWMEGVIVLATLARHWRPRTLPGHRVELAPALNLRPRGGMPMILERRRPPGSGRAPETAEAP